MSPLRRHNVRLLHGKIGFFGGFFGPSSVKRGRTHIVLGYNMAGASTSAYPENLGSGGLIPAELRGRVCLFLFVTLLVGQLYTATSRVNIDHVRHRKPRRCVYALKLGGTGISPPDKSPLGQKTPRTKAPRTKALPDKNPPGQKSFRPKVPPGKRPSGKKSPRAKDPRPKDPRRKSAERRHILLQR